MNKLSAVALLAALTLSVGCVDEYSYRETTPYYGCVVISDEMGEREVCDTEYYYTDDGVVYWDSHFGIWVMPNGYWYGGRFWPGVYPGFHAYYHSGFYHPRGYFHSYRGFSVHRGGSYGGHGGGGHHR
jgi:hypothetical protein